MSFSDPSDPASGDPEIDAIFQKRAALQGLSDEVTKRRAAIRAGGAARGPDAVRWHPEALAAIRECRARGVPWAAIAGVLGTTIPYAITLAKRVYAPAPPAPPAARAPHWSEVNPNDWTAEQAAEAMRDYERVKAQDP